MLTQEEAQLVEEIARARVECERASEAWGTLRDRTIKSWRREYAALKSRVPAPDGREVRAAVYALSQQEQTAKAELRAAEAKKKAAYAEALRVFEQERSLIVARVKKAKQAVTQALEAHEVAMREAARKLRLVAAPMRDQHWQEERTLRETSVTAGERYWKEYQSAPEHVRRAADNRASQLLQEVA